MKSEQEVFDKVTHHLLSQQVKAADSDGACLYRTPEGRKCAIGCLIPDEEYREHMEGKGLTMVSILQALKANNILAVNDYELQGIGTYEDQSVPSTSLTRVGVVLQNLQEIHDNEDPETWRACFRTLGRALGLDYEGF